MRTAKSAPRRILALVLLLAGLAVTASGCLVAPGYGPGYGYGGPGPVYVAPPVVVAPVPVFGWGWGWRRWR